MSRHQNWPEGVGDDPASGAQPTQRLGQEPAGEPRAAEIPAGSAAGAPPFEGLVGKRLGRYVVMRFLGQGGMGLVVLARDTELRRDVALKILPVQAVFSPAARSRFRREIRAMARVEHEGVVRIHDSFDESGYVGFAMQHVAGCSLADLLDDLRRDSGSSDPRALLRERGVHVADADWRGSYGHWIAWLGSRIATALQAVHDADVLHRDVKPGNILLDADGQPRLADFGVAADPQATALTQGSVCGTTAYAAPELLQSREDMDSRVDVFGLGATLYECLTLTTPVRGSAVTALEQWRAGRVVPLRRRRIDAPSDLVVLVDRALDVDPARRFPAAREFGAELRAVADGESIRTRPISRVRRIARRVRQRRARLVAVTALLIAAVATGLLIEHDRRQQEQQERQEQQRERLLFQRELDARLAESSLLMRFRSQWSGALQNAHAALAMAPDDPLVALNTIRASVRAGDIEGARRVLQRPELQSVAAFAAIGEEMVEQRLLDMDDLVLTAPDDRGWREWLALSWLATDRGAGGRFGSHHALLAFRYAEIASDRASGESSELIRGQVLLTASNLQERHVTLETVVLPKLDVPGLARRYQQLFPASWTAQLHVASVLSNPEPDVALEACDRAESLGAPAGLVHTSRLRAVFARDGLAASYELAKSLFESSTESSGTRRAGLVSSWTNLIGRAGRAAKSEDAKTDLETVRALDEATRPWIATAIADLEAVMAAAGPDGHSTGLRYLYLDLLDSSGDTEKSLAEHRAAAADYPGWWFAAACHGVAVAEAAQSEAYRLKRLASRHRPWSDEEIGDFRSLLDEADRALLRAYQLAPAHMPVLASRGRLLTVTLGRIDDAVDLLARCCQIEPGNAGHWTSLGIARRKSGDLDQAAADLERAMDIAESSDQSLGKPAYELAHVLLRRLLEARIAGTERAEGVAELREAARLIRMPRPGDPRYELTSRDQQGAAGLELLVRSLDPTVDLEAMAAELRREWEAAQERSRRTRQAIQSTFTIACAQAFEVCGAKADAVALYRRALQLTNRFQRIEPVESRRLAMEAEAEQIRSSIERLTK